MAWISTPGSDAGLSYPRPTGLRTLSERAAVAIIKSFRTRPAEKSFIRLASRNNQREVNDLAARGE